VPGGSVAALAATVFGSEPGQEVQEDLRRFKQVMEIGEVVRSDASIHPRLHSARPPEQHIPLQPGFRSASPPQPTPPPGTADATEGQRPSERSTRTGSQAATSARGGAR
jgi:hypothetical protein